MPLFQAKWAQPTLVTIILFTDLSNIEIFFISNQDILSSH